MRILIYGAGVIGSFYASRFAKAGLDVTVLASVVILTPGLFDFNTVPVYGASDRILFYVLNLLTISS